MARSKAYPPTPAQEELLLHHLRVPDSGIGIEQVIGSLHEDLDVGAAQAAWQHVVDARGSLRTRFEWVRRKQPVLRVEEKAAVPFVYQDWRQLDRDPNVELQRFLESRKGPVIEHED